MTVDCSRRVGAVTKVRSGQIQATLGGRPNAHANELSMESGQTEEINYAS
jgi:hypothetical protein